MRLESCFASAEWGYVVEASLRNSLSEERFPETGTTVFKLDTGFNGPVMVTGDIFELLHFSNIEVPEDLRPSYATLAGPIVMRSAPAEVEIGRRKVETDILTPLTGAGRMLVGFQVIRQFDIALLRDRACLIKVVKPRDTSR